ncbi:MAG TPA: hypothetical protein VIR98_02010 [Candidatus Paceibacterota bacterium]
MIIEELSEEEIEWIRRNKDFVKLLVSKNAQLGIALEVTRKERRQSLLQPISMMYIRGWPCVTLDRLLLLSRSVLEVREVRADEQFRAWFSRKVETEVPAVRVMVSKLIHVPERSYIPYTTDAEIRDRIGEGNLGLQLAHIWEVLPRLDRTFWYRFYSHDVQNVLRVITAFWYQHVLHLSACQTGYPDELANGGCVVSHCYR